jgi:hypothetical protein
MFLQHRYKRTNIRPTTIRQDQLLPLPVTTTTSYYHYSRNEPNLTKCDTCDRTGPNQRHTSKSKACKKLRRNTTRLHTATEGIPPDHTSLHTATEGIPPDHTRLHTATEDLTTYESTHFITRFKSRLRNGITWSSVFQTGHDTFLPNTSRTRFMFYVICTVHLCYLYRTFFWLHKIMIRQMYTLLFLLFNTVYIKNSPICFELW